MRPRILGLALGAASLAPALLGHLGTADAAPQGAARVFVTGYVDRGYTASGVYTHPGTCAIDPRFIPMGSTITIDGLGTCHAEDTGGAVIGYHVDIWVQSVAVAYAITGWRNATWVSTVQRVLGYPTVPTVTATSPQRPITSAPTPTGSSRGQANLVSPTATTPAFYANRVDRVAPASPTAAFDGDGAPSTQVPGDARVYPTLTPAVYRQPVVAAVYPTTAPGAAYVASTPASSRGSTGGYVTYTPVASHRDSPYPTATSTAVPGQARRTYVTYTSVAAAPTHSPSPIGGTHATTPTPVTAAGNLGSGHVQCHTIRTTTTVNGYTYHRWITTCHV